MIWPAIFEKVQDTVGSFSVLAAARGSHEHGPADRGAQLVDPGRWSWRGGLVPGPPDQEGRSSAAIVRGSAFSPLKPKEELRAMTNRPGIFERLVMMSSTRPSAK